MKNEGPKKGKQQQDNKEQQQTQEQQQGQQQDTKQQGQNQDQGQKKGPRKPPPPPPPKKKYRNSDNLGFRIIGYILVTVWILGVIGAWWQSQKCDWLDPEFLKLFVLHHCDLLLSLLSSLL